MKEKARDNLKAARTLVGIELFDPAASRVHYAALQAAMAALEAQGITPDQARQHATYWNHDMVVNSAYRIRQSREDERLIRKTKACREQADYKPQPVDPLVIKSCLDEVEKFVKDLLP